MVCTAMAGGQTILGCYKVHGGELNVETKNYEGARFAVCQSAFNGYSYQKILKDDTKTPVDTLSKLTDHGDRIFRKVIMPTDKSLSGHWLNALLQKYDAGLWNIVSPILQVRFRPVRFSFELFVCIFNLRSD